MNSAWIAFLPAALLAAPACAADGPPNIVFVLFDDIGYGQPTCYRADSPFKTPSIDRLAREGMRFTDAHSAASNCTPARYGVLTGRYPSRIGQFGVLKTYSAPIIPRTRPTVASFLRKHGYHTSCIGKWHLGMTWVDGKPGTEKQLPVGARPSPGGGGGPGCPTARTRSASTTSTATPTRGTSAPSSSKTPWWPTSERWRTSR